MPVELKIDTDGKTEQKRIEVVGTDSPFSIETFGKPRRIVIDPDDRVLKNSAEIKLRASIRFCSVLPSVSIFNSTGMRNRSRSCEICPTTRNPLPFPSR